MRRLTTGLIVIVGMLVWLPDSWAQSADQQKIRALDKDWVAAVGTGDAAAVTAFYAKDGAILPPGSPVAQGHDAIGAVWQSLLGMPGFQLNFAPSSIEVAASGDMAYEIGSYDLAYDGDQGQVKDTGKYVVVWKKEDGAWKVAADIFNSNGAAQ